MIWFTFIPTFCIEVYFLKAHILYEFLQDQGDARKIYIGFVLSNEIKNNNRQSYQKGNIIAETNFKRWQSKEIFLKFCEIPSTSMGIDTTVTLKSSLNSPKLPTFAEVASIACKIDISQLKSLKVHN